MPRKVRQKVGGYTHKAMIDEIQILEREMRELLRSLINGWIERGDPRITNADLLILHQLSDKVVELNYRISDMRDIIETESGDEKKIIDYRRAGNG